MNITVRIRPVHITGDYEVRIYEIKTEQDFYQMRNRLNDNSNQYDFSTFAIVRVEFDTNTATTTTITTLHHAGDAAKRMIERHLFQLALSNYLNN